MCVVQEREKRRPIGRGGGGGEGREARGSEEPV